MTQLSNNKSSYYTILVVFCVVIQLICNLTVTKLVSLWGFFIPFSSLIYPATFAAADIMTECYGFKFAVKAIWINAFSQIVFFACILGALHSPSPGFWKLGHAYQQVFSVVRLELFSSVVSLILSKLTNDYIISKLKTIMFGKRLWLRSIISSMFGELILVLIAYNITFFAKYSELKILEMIFFSWLLKIFFAILYCPFITLMSNYIKIQEQTDIFTENHQSYLFLGINRLFNKPHHEKNY